MSGDRSGERERERGGARGSERGAGTVTFTFEGRALTARAGEPIAIALWGAGEKTLRASSRDGAPRGMLCAMGVCYECLVQVDGRTVRGCTTPVQDGMRVTRGGKP